MTLTQLSNSRPENATATLVVRQGSDVNTPTTDKLILIGDYSQKLLGQDVAIKDESLRGDTLTLSAHFVGGCVPSYFALFAVDELGGSGGNEVALYLKRVARPEFCGNPTHEALKFDISALRKFLNLERQEIELKLFGCSNSLATGPERLRFPFGNYENQPPVLDSIGLLQFAVGVEKRAAIYASDPDGTVPRISCAPLPENARVESTIDTAFFVFTPEATQVGWHELTVYASDGALSTSELVLLHVARTEVNAAPIIELPPQLNIAETEILSLPLVVHDPDSEFVTVSPRDLPVNAVLQYAFGRYNLLFQPTYTQAGNYAMWFVASDGLAADTATIFLQVMNTDRAPEIRGPSSEQRVRIGNHLEFSLWVSDPDQEDVGVQCVNLPDHASLVEGYYGGSWLFRFDLDLSQAAYYDLIFVAASGDLADTSRVTVEVFDNSHSVTIDSIPPQEVTEGQSLTVAVSASSSRGAPIAFTAIGLGALGISRLAYQADGHAQITVRPGYRSAGSHSFRVTAEDYYAADTMTFTIDVIEAGDQAPWFRVESIERFYTAGDDRSLEIPVSDPDGESVICTLKDAPPFVGVYIANGNWILSLTSSASDAGSYHFNVEAMDQDNPTLTAQLPVTITLHVLQHNSGSLFPAAIGNYWVYSTGGSWGSGIDSIEIIDTTTVAGELRWELNTGEAFIERADTILWYNRDNQVVRKLLPKAGFDSNGLRCSKFAEPVVVPAGSFAEAYEFGRSDYYSRLQYIYAPGVGMLVYYVGYMDSTWGPVNSTSSELVRFRVN